ncbi:MAG TPA: hypothetical protein VGU67_02775 [Edaphobacter sp.]|nr:hypothetical protein [Edaphobacter sp.]
MTSHKIRSYEWPEYKLIQEIAAQLAEHNERCLPRLVQLTYKSKPFCVNVKEVSAVGQQTDSGKSYIAIGGRQFTCDQTYEEVLKALGMEVSDGTHL